MENSNFRIGMTAIEVLVEIIRLNPDIMEFNINTYRPTYNLKENYQVRKGIRVPLLERLLSHNQIQFRDKKFLKRTDVTVEKFNQIIVSLPEDSVLSVLSEVRDRVGRIYHIPMIDFSFCPSRENTNQIEHFLRTIDRKGVILFSGRSYHFYSAQILVQEGWLKFLGQCLLSGLIDERYVGHRLIENCGELRLSACPLRPKVPTVVSIL